MKQPSIIAHLRDILILPFTVTCVVPYFIDKPILSSPVYLQIAGILTGFCGLSLFLYTVVLFKVVGKGTLAPWSPKQRLVINGPYRYCRNPMITGVWFILIGETIFFWSAGLLQWTIIFFLLNTIYFYLVEEPNLLQRFGGDYREYKSNVPRWLPRLTPYQHV